MFSFASKVSPPPKQTITSLVDSAGESMIRNEEDRIEYLIYAVKRALEGKILGYQLNDNEILKRFKDFGYNDGLNKKDMNKFVLDSFSLTPNYRYADAYAKGYKQGKEKAIFSTKYGGKSRKHRKVGKKTMKKKSRKHRK